MAADPVSRPRVEKSRERQSEEIARQIREAEASTGPGPQGTGSSGSGLPRDSEGRPQGGEPSSKAAKVEEAAPRAPKRGASEAQLEDQDPRLGDEPKQVLDSVVRASREEYVWEIQAAGEDNPVCEDLGESPDRYTPKRAPAMSMTCRASGWTLRESNKPGAKRSKS